MNPIVPIVVGTNSSNGEFLPRSRGTGFVVHHEPDRSFVVTCAHVVDAIACAPPLGEQPVGIHIQHHQAEIQHIGDRNARDLAVLTVPRLDCVPLKLQDQEELKGEFKCYGWYIDDQLVPPSLTGKIVRGRFGERVDRALDPFGLSFMQGVDLLVGNDLGHWTIVPGYSGSPIQCPDSGSVVGVVTQHAASKREGFGIAIRELREIGWVVPASSWIGQAASDGGHAGKTDDGSADSAAAKRLLEALEVSRQTFLAQARVRDSLVERVRTRVGDLDPMQFEEFFSSRFDSLTKFEAELHRTIRGYTDTIYEHNLAALRIIDESPSLRSRLSCLGALKSHLTVWRSKYENVFRASPWMGVLYVGVLEGIPFPTNAEREIEEFVKFGD